MDLQTPYLFNPHTIKFKISEVNLCELLSELIWLPAGGGKKKKETNNVTGEKGGCFLPLCGQKVKSHTIYYQYHLTSF